VFACICRAQDDILTIECPYGLVADDLKVISSMKLQDGAVVPIFVFRSTGNYQVSDSRLTRRTAVCKHTCTLLFTGLP
jgi:hypothetical protein